MYAKRRSTLKKMIAALSVILVLLVGVAGTLSYLQVATQPVQNTFAPSNIDLKLEETTSDYKMIPGEDIAKDPKVTVTADIDCYVFVKVEESDDFDTYMTYAIASGWKLLNTNTGEETEITDKTELNGTFVLVREVSAGVAKDSEAFYVLADNKVTVRNTVTKTQMNDLYNPDGTVITANQLKLTFTAYAIQKAGFTTVAAAWEQAKTATN